MEQADDRSTDPLKYTSLTNDPDESHMLALGLLGGARRVLEVGAATGYVTEAIQRTGANVVAVEIDEKSAAVARGRGLDIRVGRVEDVVGRDEMFDCIALLDIVEHVTDPDLLMTCCLSHLEPGGSIVLSVPNIAHWRVRWALARGRFNYTRTGLMDSTHVRLYTESSLERLLASHHLAVTERRHALGLYSYAVSRSDEWRWQRRRLLRLAARRWPTLFAFQFVWKATAKAGAQ